MEKVRNIAINITIFTFVFICIFFPADPLHLKLLAYFATILLGADVLIKNLRNSYYWPIYFMGALYPVVIIVWSLLLGNATYQTIKQAYPAALLLLVIIIKELKVEYSKWTIWILVAMTSVTIVLGIIDVLGIVDVNKTILNVWMQQVDSGYFRRNGQGFIKYRFFFKTSPLLMLPAAYFIKEKKWFWTFVLVLGIYFSGTRGNIFAAVGVMGLCVLLLLNEEVKEKKARRIIAAVLVLFMLACLPVGVKLVSGVQNSKQSSESDSIKSGQMQGMIEDLSNPKDFLLGYGFGSYFADKGREGLVHESGELSYLDFFRKSGFILFIPFALFLVAPFTWKTSWYMKVAYFGYMFIAATNPYLYNSTGYILFIYLYVNRPDQTWLTQRLENKFGRK